MILISSGAYVGNDLISEFGKLPPSFLPLQNARLYHHQLDLFPIQNERKVLSIPQDYILDEKDEDNLNQRNVEIIRVPLNISLGSSIVYVLNSLGSYDESLYLLFGDTLFSAVSLENDVCYVARAQDHYAWDFIEGENSDLIFAGFFSFQNQKQLIQAICEKNHSFIDAVKSYNTRTEITYNVVDDWLDFGLTSTYFKSKSLFTTQRVFNDLQVSKFSVTKSSKKKKKMIAESSWYQNVPSSIKYHAPKFYTFSEDHEKCYYEIEYLFSSSLSDLYVFGAQPIFVWKEIFSSCRDFLQTCFQEKMPQEAQSNYALREKTVHRLAEFSKISGFDLNQTLRYNGLDLPSLNEIVEEIDAAFTTEGNLYASVVHGDFCFSNILYDFRRKSIQVIDPRGLDFNDQITIYGDIRYDLAKLAHSVIGLYDYIMCGYYELEVSDKGNFTFRLKVGQHIPLVQSEFLSLKFFDKTIEEHNMYPSMVHLFLSMIPLHGDDYKRQNALLANALRLYLDWKLLSK